MSLVVQKYGGTSVGTVERIQAVAERVGKAHAAGHQVVVVVSAMAGETNRLLELAGKLASQPSEREVDVLLATGEQESAALLAIALQQRGFQARSFLGHQIRIDTDSAFGRARIRSIDGDRLHASLGRGEVAVVAGFQGVDGDSNITTLGRGGSDTSAVAVAAALKADVCEIYTDVDGVYTSDPRICPQARKLHRISHDEMLELASLGAKVLQIRSVEFAKRYHVLVHVRSSFDESDGTWVVPEDEGMEQVLVSGVSLDRDQAKITVRHVPDRPGVAFSVLGPIARANIVVDMIIQNASAAGDTDLTFTLPKTDFRRALAMVEQTAKEIGAQGVTSDTDVVKVSVVGLGMRSHAGVAARMFEVLAREGINIQMISTSEIKISVVIDAKYGELAVRALHAALVESSLDGASPLEGAAPPAPGAGRGRARSPET
jgi:aspartate kinase